MHFLTLNTANICALSCTLGSLINTLYLTHLYGVVGSHPLCSEGHNVGATDFLWVCCAQYAYNCHENIATLPSHL